jgi:hypothetical protein
MGLEHLKDSHRRQLQLLLCLLLAGFPFFLYGWWAYYYFFGYELVFFQVFECGVDLSVAYIPEVPHSCCD